MQDINWDNELTLIQQRYEMDSIGNSTPIEQPVKILTRVKSVNRQEFYLAGQSGIRPEMMFEIHAIEYSGETELEYSGQRYSIIRTFQLNHEILELVCQRKAGDWDE